MHEILTLQLGQRSNYLATHFWNTQESYFTYSGEEEPVVDHDVHFRPGIGADGAETFTPRTVIYDLKGGFGTLRKLNALYELDEDRAASAGAWNGAPIMRPQPTIEPSAYQLSLENGTTPPQLTKESIRYWSDFNRVYFHPKSIVQLNEYELGSTLMPFENWSVGEDLFNSLDKEHDLLDRDLRSFAEEADHMQGIQIMASVDDAWGGFAARYMERLRDEYGKTALWVFGLEGNAKQGPRSTQFLKLSNTARSIAEVSSQASLYIPLTIPSSLPSYTTLDPSSLWQASALLSTALETMTLPSRLHSRAGTRASLADTGAALNVNGTQNIARLQMSIGEDPVANGEGHDAATRETGDRRLATHGGRLSEEDEDGGLAELDMDFFPVDAPAMNGRGRRADRRLHTFGRVESSRSDQETGDDNDGDDLDGRDRARRRAAGLPIMHKTSTPLAYPLPTSFPHIYNRTSAALSVRTSLSTDTRVAARIKSLQTTVGRAIGVEEREALSNALGEMAEGYEEGWSSGSDEDED
ncbi:hypothetical protein V501_01166 [Pseudogymnoascus sp. VKM F-4519 (FW-2642)]|nr:hypothetical protein V501_01166 [Pseudogymnoascus sp. VKM F-4519 (FW-2642)]